MPEVVGSVWTEMQREIRERGQLDGSGRLIAAFLAELRTTIEICLRTQSETADVRSILAETQDEIEKIDEYMSQSNAVWTEDLHLLINNIHVGRIGSKAKHL